MKDKIIKAAIEGKLIRKSFNKIIREIGFDRFLGIISRKIAFRNLEVIPNKIFFNTFQGDYTCNPKYITEELLKQNVNCEIVWGIRLGQLKKNYVVPANVKLVNRYTYDFYKEMMSSKVWIINSVEIFKNPVSKKRNQFLIQTWHGSLGIKKFDKGVNSGKSWVKAAEVSATFTDYCLSNSKFENSVLVESFWNKSILLEYGHPRNDILFLENEEANNIKEKVKEELGLSGEYNYLLYGPTFRDAKNFDCYDLDYEKLIVILEEKFGGNWKILVRFHPTVRELSAGVLEKKILFWMQQDILIFKN